MGEALGEEVVWKPIVWLAGAVRVGKKKRSTYFHLAYCTHGKGIAFVAVDTLHVAVISSVDIHKAPDGSAYCGDARWCFNLKCPLNRVEPEKMKHYGVRTMEDVKKAHEKLEEFLRVLEGAIGEMVECGGVIWFKRAPIVVGRG